MSKVAEGLTPDYGDYAEIKISADQPRPFDDGQQIPEYWAAFRNIVKCYGKVAYYWKTLRNLRNEVPEVKNLAASRDHDELYYRKAVETWTWESRRALQIYKIIAYSQKVRFSYEDRNFLNGLIDEDRRNSYYDTIRLGEKKGVIFTPEEIEARYQKRLEKRKKA